MIRRRQLAPRPRVELGGFLHRKEEFLVILAPEAEDFVEIILL
jgi:hypothetical protein